MLNLAFIIFPTKGTASWVDFEKEIMIINKIKCEVYPLELKNILHQQKDRRVV